MRVLVDELDDPHGILPYQESPGVWICRRCAADIRHEDALCIRCKQREKLDDD
jgi:hypothetical protein